MNSKSNIYKKLLREYKVKRMESEEIRKAKIENLYEEIPLIEDIDNQIRQIAIKSGLELLRGKDVDYATELGDLEAAKTAELMLHGYPEDYLEPSYYCEKCKDTGFIESEECTCFKQEIAREYYKMSNLDKILERENFTTFDFNLFSDIQDEMLEISPRKNIEIIYNASLKFIRNFEKDEEHNLLFYGTTGLGKTFMVNCIAKDLLDIGHTVIYQTAHSLIGVIEEYKFSKTDDIIEAKDKYDYLLKADLLIIDDLGSESINSFTNSEIFNIINTRNLARKKMLISTNLTPGEIAKTYTDRVYSRILDRFNTYQFIGSDLRWKL
ncbi:MAG: ATP-binding protein [Neofamilia sp.]